MGGWFLGCGGDPLWWLRWAVLDTAGAERGVRVEVRRGAIIIGAVVCLAVGTVVVVAGAVGLGVDGSGSGSAWQAVIATGVVFVTLGLVLGWLWFTDLAVRRDADLD